jgi:hypothetical protein
MKKFGINYQKDGVNFFGNHLSYFNWKTNDECSTPLEIAQRLSYPGIGHGKTVCVTAFPIVNEL